MLITLIALVFTMISDWFPYFPCWSYKSQELHVVYLYKWWLEYSQVKWSKVLIIQIDAYIDHMKKYMCDIAPIPQKCLLGSGSTITFLSHKSSHVNLDSMNHKPGERKEVMHQRKYQSIHKPAVTLCSQIRQHFLKTFCTNWNMFTSVCLKYSCYQNENCIHWCL